MRVLESGTGQRTAAVSMIGVDDLINRWRERLRPTSDEPVSTRAVLYILIFWYDRSIAFSV